LRPATDRNPGVVAGERLEFTGFAGLGNHVFDLSALQAVGQVVARQRHRGRHQHGAQLDPGQHDFPQLDPVRQHQQHPLAAPHAEIAQVFGHLARARGHVGEGDLAFAAVFFDHPQGGSVIVPRLMVEEVERPVEAIEFGLLEITVGGVVVEPVPLEEVARLHEALGWRHGVSPGRYAMWMAGCVTLPPCDHSATDSARGDA